MASYEHDKANLQVRLRRIEGQVRGLQRMIDEDKYCVDVLTQVSSVIAALQKVGVIVLEDHIRGCVRTALAEGRDDDRAIEELLTVVERFVKAGPVSDPPTLVGGQSVGGEPIQVTRDVEQA